MRPTSSKLPPLTATQRLWLQELGVPRSLLSVVSPMPQSERRRPTAKPRVQQTVGSAQLGQQPSAPAAAAGVSAVAEAAKSPAAGLLKSLGKADSQPEAESLVASQSSQTTTSSVAAAATKLMQRSIVSDLKGLHEQVLACQACSFHAERQQAIFGEGDTQTPALFVVGEAPGLEDDRQGQPFQGGAGQLLQNMLAAIGLTPQQTVFMTTAIKCRPPINAEASHDALAACTPYLKQQIVLMQPARLLLLGSLAASALFTESPFEEIRGTAQKLKLKGLPPIPAVATYAPSFLLTRPHLKLEAWRDLQALADLF